MYAGDYLAYFMSGNDYRQLWINFFAAYGIRFNSDYRVSREISAKIPDTEIDLPSGGRIDILIEDKEGNRYYTSGSDDDKTLAAFNTECEKKGCKKGIHR